MGCHVCVTELIEDEACLSDIGGPPFHVALVDAVVVWMVPFVCEELLHVRLGAKALTGCCLTVHPCDVYITFCVIVCLDFCVVCSDRW